MLSASVGIGNGLFQMALVAFIAFFFYRDGNSLARRGRLFLKRVSGDLADEYTGILVNTTRSVVFGVLGTAVGQGGVRLPFGSPQPIRSAGRCSWFCGELLR